MNHQLIIGIILLAFAGLSVFLGIVSMVIAPEFEVTPLGALLGKKEKVSEIRTIHTILKTLGYLSISFGVAAGVGGFVLLVVGSSSASQKRVDRSRIV